MTATDDHRTATLRPRAGRHRTRLRLEGLVQGVGFRPYVSRLANALDLKGWVANSGEGVTIEIEGPGPAVERFLSRLGAELPPLARLDRLEAEELSPEGGASFTIRRSMTRGRATALILPDVAVCDDCLNEVLNPSDRRYRYPFTNCTNCGPRFSIVEALPYDRANTTMRRFAMCAACRAEYEDPQDRRFHAQPNACPECGPQLALLDPAGRELAVRHEALSEAVDALRRGRIVALKGLGGFQLLADARNAETVAELRRRKNRPDKPFAVMASSLAEAGDYCRISGPERELLASPEAPIVLLARRDVPDNGRQSLAQSIAPGNPLLGVMLPYTPLHHLLMHELGFPIVATSGNLADEPMVTDVDEALGRLGGIADLFFVYDRPIAAAVDDSVVRVMAGRAMVLRRARGYAPFPLAVKGIRGPGLLALGGHFKVAPAVTVGSRMIVAPHVGDLDTAPARQAFQDSVDRLTGLYGARPRALACDGHPDYYSTRFAARSGAKTIAVQHHLAHILACMAENGMEDEHVLGVAWDGTGYGDDGTIWGGEFFLVDGTKVRRIASFRPFPLPGGETAVIEPRRAAVGLLYELIGKQALADESLAPVGSFSPAERKTLARMLARNLNSPRSSSVGRLFDAVASLLGLAQITSFEGQAAMALEFAADGHSAHARYDLQIDLDRCNEDEPVILDWRPMARRVIADLRRGVETAHIAAAFQGALVEAICGIAQWAGESRVVLTGGCFQNRRLTEGAVDRLRHAGFEPVWHQHLPPNDGSLAVGQAVWAARLLGRGDV